MKYTGFSLNEIKYFMKNKHNTKEISKELKKLISTKHKEILLKIKHFEKIASILELSAQITNEATTCKIPELDVLVEQVFYEIRTQNEGEV